METLSKFFHKDPKYYLRLQPVIFHLKYDHALSKRDFPYIPVQFHNEIYLILYLHRLLVALVNKEQRRLFL